MTAAATAAAAIPLPRPAADPAAAAPIVFTRSLAEVDRDLADLAVHERRHREALTVARRALADLAVRRELLTGQRRRSIAVAVGQLDAG